MTDSVRWVQAKYAGSASAEAKAICCGDQYCFNSRGCDTAKWVTRRIEEKGYRLVNAQSGDQ